MARPEGSPYRDQWWAGKLKGATTPKARVTVLQAKILADISKLPECQRDDARNLVAIALEGLLDEIQIHSLEERFGAMA
jgi:hypothetical protein